MNKSLKYDFRVNRRTALENALVTSWSNLSGFKIGVKNGLNALTGEQDGDFEVKLIDIWSLHY